jgi:hypothetical protein
MEEQAGVHCCPVLARCTWKLLLVGFETRCIILLFLDHLFFSCCWRTASSRRGQTAWVISCFVPPPSSRNICALSPCHILSVVCRVCQRWSSGLIEELVPWYSPLHWFRDVSAWQNMLVESANKYVRGGFLVGLIGVKRIMLRYSTKSVFESCFVGSYMLRAQGQCT